MVTASPALARDGAWYVGGEFGAMVVENADIDINGTTPVVLDHDYGFDGGLFVGYDLGAFRIEAEAAYRKADLDSFETTIRLPGETAPTLPAKRDFEEGSTSALSFMVNGMLDFGDDDGVSGFAGGGVGLARVKANNMRVFANSAPFLDDSDSTLAWQVFAGLRYPVGENTSLHLKYRYFSANGLRFDDGVDRGDARFRTHSLLGGITFNFGSPDPM